ncbi:hypothetical protein BDC45DRAFT_568344 [Circinella umbellata]|nr:hypothetical protein BDC45DRAFT_568344 [Circinella umbellata]
MTKESPFQSIKVFATFVAESCGNKRSSLDNSVDGVMNKRSKVNYEEELTQQEDVDAVVIGGNKSLLSDDDLYDNIINHDDAFWDDWVDLMDKNPRCHQYDLDKYHVLQYGYDGQAIPEVPQRVNR